MLPAWLAVSVASRGGVAWAALGTKCARAISRSLAPRGGGEVGLVLFGGDGGVDEQSDRAGYGRPPPRHARLGRRARARPRSSGPPSLADSQCRR